MYYQNIKNKYFYILKPKDSLKSECLVVIFFENIFFPLFVKLKYGMSKIFKITEILYMLSAKC
jgi:hypothetical protein